MGLVYVNKTFGTGFSLTHLESLAGKLQHFSRKFLVVTRIRALQAACVEFSCLQDVGASGLHVLEPQGCMCWSLRAASY